MASDDTKRIDTEPNDSTDFDPHEVGWLVASMSNDGMVRSNNEDAIFTFASNLSDNDPMPKFGVFIMADGAGGHEDGEKASSLTTRIVSKALIERVYLPSLRGVPMNDVERATIADVLADAITEANDQVLQNFPEGGCTCTAAVISDNTLYVGHVGDSRLYFIDKDSIEIVTRDHSVAQRLVEIGSITPEQARNHPKSSVLYRGIGMGSDNSFDVDIYRKRLKAGDSILLCSDGLWDLVEDDFIHTTVTKTKLPQQACKTLITQANINGGHDNVSVIIVSSYNDQ